MNLVAISLIVLASTLVGVKGQFPKACINKADLNAKRCCPVPGGFKEPCGNEMGRGECRELQGQEWNEIYDHYDDKHLEDDRHNWPRLFFNRTCHCNPPFYGPDCGTCEFGYHGERCTKRKTLLRRNFMKLTPEKKEQYMKYVNLSRYVISDYVVATTFLEDIQATIARGEDPLTKFDEVPVYDLFVWQHYYAARNTFLKDGTMKEDIDFAHDGQGFPTWHRLYLLAWERALQEVNDDGDFAIPYWDWTDNDLKELCTKEVLGENTESGTVEGKYLDGWYSICTTGTIPTSAKNGTRICDPKLHRVPGLERNPSKKIPLPKKEHVDFLLRFERHDVPPYSKYSSCNFRNLLEGYISTTTAFYSPKSHTLHNQAHLHIGGAMEDVPSASNDPIFYLHHSFVDRILEKWLRKYKKDPAVLSKVEAPIGHNKNDPIVPLFPIRTHGQMFKKSGEFGYEYEDVGENGRFNKAPQQTNIKVYCGKLIVISDLGKGICVQLHALHPFSK